MKTFKRFMAKVNILPGDQCWNWTGSTRDCGYGMFWDGRTIQASHFLLKLSGVEIPAGLYVCHKCDNPHCVRPSHLFVGTQKDNMQDAAKKGRVPKGLNHPFRKLTLEQVSEAKKCSRKWKDVKDLARKFCVSTGTIYYIREGKTWKHQT